MRFCAFREYDAVATGVGIGERVVALDDLNDAMGTDYGPDLDAFLRRRQHLEFAKRIDASRAPRSGWRPENLRYAPPLARPSKIWGVGLNFAAHAQEVAGELFDEPVGWMRPATTLAGDGATVTLPPGIGAVTAEAEIGIVLGRAARNLGSRREARDAVFGFVPVLDLTAEDLLRKNVRNLTRAKSYDGFCVMGPFITTTDEWEPSAQTRIVTEVDGRTKEGLVAQMRHDPYELVRFFSHVFPWEAGDVLLTGTPGALPLKPGSQMRARIDGLGELRASAQ
ncbi:MAG TPA: fumarylacetoacetate hydrolase family protein [Candidatus Thermoplasmatota archaeon]|nr:fumarylacetoacetate hydrolase family protein [Candidatus Thermoplasmatota archaeon]